MHACTHARIHRTWFSVVLLLALSGCQPTTLNEEWHRLEPRPEAPAFSLSTLDGSTVTLSDLRGQVVLLDFWATWCPPCRASMPSLEHTYRAYRTRGATVLLVNAGERPDQIRAWIGHRVTAPILLDPQQAVARAYGVETLPRLFVIDASGHIAFEHGGYGGGLEQSLKLILSELLPKNP